MLGKCLLFPATLLAFWNAQASVLFTDAFSYPDGPLVSVSDGRWKTHSGTSGQVEVRSGRLYLSQKKTEDVSALLTETGTLTATNTAALYARFRVAFSALPSGTYFAHFKDASTTTGLRCRIFACTNGAAAGSFRLGIAAAASAATSLFPQDLQLQREYQVVCRLLLSNNVSTLWVNPKAESDVCVTSTDPTPPKGVTAFAFRQSLTSGVGMGELGVDDVIVATTFREVSLVSAPAILVHPQGQTVAAGSEVEFTVQAGGPEPISYQWLFNGLELPGATNPILTLSNVSMADAGRYEALVSNSGGLVSSAAAMLVVEPGPLALSIALAEKAGVQLRWSAAPDLSYSVLASDSVDASFIVLSAGLCFPDGAGLFLDEASSGAGRFYQVSSP
jgi:hypothetical protein